MGDQCLFQVVLHKHIFQRLFSISQRFCDEMIPLIDPIIERRLKASNLHRFDSGLAWFEFRTFPCLISNSRITFSIELENSKVSA